MYFLKSLLRVTIFAVGISTTIAEEPDAHDSRSTLEACAPLWDVALSLRDQFLVKRATVDPLGLLTRELKESYDRLMGYYSSGMYNMLEACGTLQSFKWPPKG
ncbi:hypothetical protein CDEST_06240 [Colletotrichum destructivum]|uniref:Uncharacterized protein n=1 Tax=Colletotrichum destructivum TaxID=34406 RepID=A0AAX4IDK5_9PEZI|nr:hypothetical protein CDEST_06240 [Colletotrichum destructivum]